MEITSEQDDPFNRVIQDIENREASEKSLEISFDAHFGEFFPNSSYSKSKKEKL